MTKLLQYKVLHVNRQPSTVNRQPSTVNRQPSFFALYSKLCLFNLFNIYKKFLFFFGGKKEPKNHFFLQKKQNNSVHITKSISKIIFYKIGKLTKCLYKKLLFEKSIYSFEYFQMYFYKNYQLLFCNFNI